MVVQCSCGSAFSVAQKLICILVCAVAQKYFEVYFTGEILVVSVMLEEEGVRE